MQPYDSVALSYSRYSAHLANDLWDDEHHGVNGSIRIIGVALEPELFEQSEQDEVVRELDRLKD